MTVLSTVSASVLTLFRALRYFVFLLSYSHSSSLSLSPFSFLSLFVFLFVYIFPSISLCVLSIHILPPILIDLLQAKVMIMRIIIIMMMMISTMMIAFLFFIARHNPQGDAIIGYFFVFHVIHCFRKRFVDCGDFCNCNQQKLPRERNTFYNKLNGKFIGRLHSSRSNIVALCATSIINLFHFGETFMFTQIARNDVKNK